MVCSFGSHRPKESHASGQILWAPTGPTCGPRVNTYPLLEPAQPDRPETGHQSSPGACITRVVGLELRAQARSPLPWRSAAIQYGAATWHQEEEEDKYPRMQHRRWYLSYPPTAPLAMAIANGSDHTAQCCLLQWIRCWLRPLPHKSSCRSAAAAGNSKCTPLSYCDSHCPIVPITIGHSAHWEESRARL